MRHDLDTLKNEIDAAFAGGNFVVFHGLGREDATPPVRWDVEHYPDPKAFLDAATKAGVKMIVFHHREFQRGTVEETLDDLQTADLPREDQRDLERRLRKLSDYEGFTCTIELSFQSEGVVYMYETAAPWFDEFISIFDQIQDYLDAGEDEGGAEPGPLGYFSKN